MTGLSGRGGLLEVRGVFLDSTIGRNGWSKSFLIVQHARVCVCVCVRMCLYNYAAKGEWHHHTLGTPPNVKSRLGLSEGSLSKLY